MHSLFGFKHAGFKSQDQKYFILASSKETAIYLPNIHSPTPRNLMFFQLAVCPDKHLFLGFPWVVNEIKLKSLGGLPERLCKAGGLN
jgi:hypothetical protein